MSKYSSLYGSDDDGAWRVHLALLFVQACFGGFHVAARAVVQRLGSPLALAGLRVALAAPLLMVQARAVDGPLPVRPHLPRLALLGLLGVTINQLLYMVGVKHTTAVNAAILIPSVPAFTVLVSLVLGVERVGPRRLAGVLVSMAGALVLLRPHRFTLDDGTVMGNVLVLLNCLSYSAFLVVQRPLHAHLPWRTIIAWAFALGGVAVLAISARDLAALDPATLTWQAVAGLLYIVIFPTVLGYGLNTWAVKRSSAVLVAAYTTLQPLFASLLAWLLLSETIGWEEVISFTLLVGGLWVVSGGKKEGS